MRKYISKLITYISNPLKVKLLLALMKQGYLHQRGWLNSLLSDKIIGNKNQPLPWISYPAIDFLEQNLSAQTEIFEYGSGYSTAYYCKRYNSVTSVEHNPEWCEKVKLLVKDCSNSTILLEENKQPYINSIETRAKRFDLIVVDGIWRNECLLKAVDFLSANGILMLDDSERIEYHEAVEQVINRGFMAIPFVGMKARSFESHTTTLFIRK